MKDALIVSALSLVPKRAASGWMGALARTELPRPVLSLLLRWYVWKYNVNLAEAAEPLSSYRSLVAFFTRALVPGARPVCPDADAVVSPADGKVYACGVVTNDRIPQSEAQHFSARELLAGKEGYEGGSYVVIYLSPRDYHRVHLPCTGVVDRFQYVPGALWPVFPAATERIPFLFSRNERLTTMLRTAFGEVALVMVGAFGVGRMRVVYDEVVTNTGGQEVVERALNPAPSLASGAEVGRFEMGSTVVLLFPPGRVDWVVSPGQPVRYGERIGKARSGHPSDV